MTSQDSTRTIQLSAAKFLSGTLLSRITGYLRDVALAYAFGTEPLLASFMVAFRFSHLARRLLGEGSLQHIFIPHFEQLRKESPKLASLFYRDLSLSLALILTGLIGISLLCLAPFMEIEIVYLTALMLPSLFFICLFGLNAALLECEKHYFLPGFAPVFFNLIWIAAALFLAGFPLAEAVQWLSIAVVAACFAQWLSTVFETERICHDTSWKEASPFSPEVKSLWKPLLLANIGVAASQVNNAIDPLFALFANSEGPAWLWYAIRLQQLPLALFGIALSGALLPPLSRAIKRGDLASASHFFHDTLIKVALFTLPISFALFSLAPSSVALLFGHGAFQDHSIFYTSLCLVCYGIGLFPMAAVLLAAPSLYAKGDFKTATLGSFYSMGLNIGLNSLFIFGFGWGSASVALATSLAALFNAWFLLNRLQMPIDFKKIGEIGLASTLGLAAAWASDYALWGTLWEIPATSVERLSTLIRESVVFGGVTCGILAWRGFHKKFF